MRIKRLLSSILLVFAAYTGISQDTHYWTQGFGGKSSLLGGAVVAGVDDNSAMYYNPANLAWINQPILSVSANVYKLTHLVVHDGVDDGVNLRSTRFILYPQLTAGLVKVKRNPRWNVVVGIMTRHFANEKAFVRVKKVTEVLSAFPGDEQFTGAFEYESNVNEQWGGCGISYRINNYFSVGLSSLISYRSQKYAFNEYSHAITSTNMVASENNSQTVVLDLFRLLWKAGLSFQKGAWKAGLTFTTPTINVAGFAVSAREVSRSNYPIDTMGGTADFIANDRNSKLKGKYKTPFSVAIGVEGNVKKAKLMLSAEFFTGIKQYDVVKAKPGESVFVSTIQDDEIVEDVFLAVTYGARPVVNVAVGYEQELTERYSLLTGFKTDFSALEKSLKLEGKMKLSPTTWNLYHISAGVTMKRKTSDFSAGLIYSVGREILPDRFARFDSPQSLYERQDVPPIETRLTTHGVTIVMGYRYYFKKE